MPQFTKNPTIITLTATVRPEVKTRFADWQAKFNSYIVGFNGFISLEFLSSPKNVSLWSIVTRFNDEKSAELWKNSQTYIELKNELQTLVGRKKLKEKIEGEVFLQNGITEVIIAKIDPNEEKAYREWSAKIHHIEAKFDGFRGVYMQSPKQSNGTHWITLLQFNNSASLDKWLASDERRAVLKEGEPFISSLETHRIASPYAGWFSSIAHIEEAPAVWKQSMIVLLVLFPIVMIEIIYLNPLIVGLGTSLSTFIGNVISVALLGFPMIPLAILMLSWWLYPKGKNRRFLTLLGVVAVLLAYFIEIVLFRYYFD